MGEELADILSTRELLAKAQPDEIGVSVSYPLPGTKFYELVKAQLGSKTHWQESNDLEMMFEGTYTSDFYRAIRNLLHDQISLQRKNSQQRDAEHFRAKRSLARSWRELLAHEVQYRSAGGDALAAR
jgi:anaerobic magnesium-protoporphyrin IX monomethyl ester cyclase